MFGDDNVLSNKNCLDFVCLVEFSSKLSEQCLLNVMYQLNFHHPFGGKK